MEVSKDTRRLSLSSWKQQIGKNQPASRGSFLHGDEQEHPRYFSGHQTQLQTLWKASQGTIKSLQDKAHHWWPQKMKAEAATRLWYELEVPRTLDISKPALSYTCNPATPAGFKHGSCSLRHMVIILPSTDAAWEQKVGGERKEEFFYYVIRLLFLWNIHSIRQRELLYR